MQKKIIYVIAIVIIGIGFWLYSAGRNDVSNVRERADNTRTQLRDAQTAQRDQAAALDRAEESADNSQRAVRDSQKATERIQGIERGDAEIIRESEQILKGIRARGKTENTN